MDITVPFLKSPFPVIDCHTHFFPQKLQAAIVHWFETHAWPIQYTDYEDNLVQTLKSLGVTRAVSLHYPHKPGMARALNAFARELASRHADFLIPFGSVHPDDTDARAILDECLGLDRFKGIKIHCHVQKVAPDDSRLIPVFEACRDHKAVLLIHCGTGPNFKDRPVNGYGYDVATVSGIAPFQRVLEKYSDVKIIVPHLGFEEIEAFLKILPAHPNLYLDTAMAIGKYFPNQVDPNWFLKYANRILFGTDFPIIPYDWNRELNTLLTMGLPEQALRAILHDNAAKLLGLTI